MPIWPWRQRLSWRDADFEANSGGWGTFWPVAGWTICKERVGGWSNYMSTLHNVWVSGLFQLDEFEIWSNAGLDVIWMRIYRGTPEIAAIFVKWLVFVHFFNSFRWSYGTCLQVCWGWVVTLLSLFSVSWVGKKNIFDFLGCFCVSARFFGTGIGPLGLEPFSFGNGSGEGMNTHDRCTICRSRTNDCLVKLQWPQWMVFFLLGWDVISVTRNIVMCKCMWVEWLGLWEVMW